MKRKLLSQMRNEWRSNVWMTVELVVVGTVLFAIAGGLASLAYIYQRPAGIDFSDIHIGRLGYIPQSASTFSPYPDSLHNYNTDLEMLLVNLKNNPYVEDAGTGTNAIPYNYNYSGSMLKSKDTDSTTYYMANFRYMSPDLVRTLRITGLRGETPARLAAMVDEGALLISDTNYEGQGSAVPADLVGHEVFCGDSSNVVKVGALVNAIRRADYEPMTAGMVIAGTPSDWMPSEIAIRAKEGKSREFMESLSSSYLESGNVYISDLMTIDKRRESAHLQFDNMTRNLTACAIFLLVAVFLGILGSFWYRTKQRIPEIALRKVNGATDSEVFRRLISEGLMILVFAIPFIVALAALVITQVELGLELPGWLLWSMIPVTAAILALTIVAGILFPARKAMKINPAEALKDQ